MQNHISNVLVIGGSGFLGTNIVCELRDRGFNLSVLDIKAPNLQIDGVEYFIGSTNNKNLLADIMHKQDCVIYLKSSTTPNSSMVEPDKAYSDVVDLIEVCELCVEHSIKRVVFASSGGTVYGQLNCERPFNEKDLTCPINHYGISKLAAENVLLMYNRLFGMRNIVLRIANPYGFGQTTLSGVGAITIFAEKMLTNQTIYIYGEGDIIRDYVEVSDVAKAFVLAVKTNDCVDFPIYNIGSGSGLSIRQVIYLLKDYLQIEPQIEVMPKRNFDVLYNVLDIRKASKELGYFPRFLPEQGIREYVQNLKLKY